MEQQWHALADLALRHDRRVSARDLANRATHLSGAQAEQAACALQDHGFAVQVLNVPALQVAEHGLPALMWVRGEAHAQPEVVLWLALEGEVASVRRYLPHAGESQGVARSDEHWPLNALQEAHSGLALVAQPLADSAARRSGDSAAAPAHWFWSVFSLVRPYYGDCIVAAVLVNVLALTTSMFSMNVYDRIIPNAALHSLWVLALGVAIGSVLELGLRSLRALWLDDAGKRADLLLSARIFSHTLNLRAEDRPVSSGQHAGQLREFESVRDFVGSTTLVAFSDLPFALFFLGVIGFLAGNLVWIPVTAGGLMIAVGVISQWPIGRSVRQYQHENSQKLAFMVESFERMETLEAMGATSAAQSRWERLSAITARSARASRLTSAISQNLMQWLQQLASTALILGGVYLILNGQLTTGGLIGCSILAGRALGPLAQVAGLMTRWQQARTAFEALDRLMRLPGRYDPERTYVHMPSARGTLALQKVQFAYPRTERVVLHVDGLSLSPGEVIGVMGPVGSGKSTLLRVLAGLQLPKAGQVLMDGVDVRQMSPADWRAHIAWVGQDAVLFRGSLRENLLLAGARVDDARLLHVLELTGIHRWAGVHPAGLDMPLGEGGQSLSGGQRQMVALARTLLSSCPVLLLDEPTSALDAQNEHALWERLKDEFTDRCVVIATHRPGPLVRVSRLVVLDDGRVVADGARDDVLQAAKEGRVKRAPAKAAMAEALA